MNAYGYIMMGVKCGFDVCDFQLRLGRAGELTRFVMVCDMRHAKFSKKWLCRHLCGTQTLRFIHYR